MKGIFHGSQKERTHSNVLPMTGMMSFVPIYPLREHKGGGRVTIFTQDKSLGPYIVNKGSFINIVQFLGA